MYSTLITPGPQKVEKSKAYSRSSSVERNPSARRFPILLYVNAEHVARELRDSKAGRRETAGTELQITSTLRRRLARMCKRDSEYDLLTRPIALRIENWPGEHPDITPQLAV